MTKEFGNSYRQMKAVLIFGAILSTLLGVIMMTVGIHRGRWDDLWHALPILLLVGVIVPLFVLPTCFFSIRIDGDHITHLFCRKWRLSERRIADLIVVEIGYSMGAIFRFNNRKTIRFIGADIMLLEAMCIFIREIRPDFQGFRFSPRVATLLAVTHKITPRGKKPAPGDS